MENPQDRYHSLLKRQLRGHPGLREIAAAHPEWLASVDAVYREFDEDRRMLERSLELTSEELMGRNEQLQVDLAHRRAIEERLEHSLSLLNAALNATADGILVTDLERKIVTCNRQFVEMWRLPPELAAGCSVDWLVEFIKKNMVDPGGFRARIDAVYGNPALVSDDVLRLKDGRVIKRLSEPQRMGDVIVGRVASFQDITEEVRGREELQRLAFHDDLTRLPNRSFFMSKLEAALDHVSGGKLLAVLFMDVDRFKVINDGLGHEAGDRLLVAVANRLRGSVPRNAMVARFGGDEFVAFMGVNNPGEANTVALGVLDALRASFEIAKHESYTSVSIGVAIEKPGGISAEALVRNADTAMYHAKRKGRARHEIFASAMYERAVSIVRVEADLRRACATMKEFELLYQPIVDRVGSLVGMEALIRWRTPEGLLTPDKFLDLAEEAGLMIPIGAWVIDEACRVLAELRDIDPELFVAVNLSVSQLEGPALRETVVAALRKHEVGGECLHLELTETELMQHGESTNTLQELRALGIPISLDDFGTGYSSLSYLTRLPLDTLKVDRSFVRELPENKEGVAITLAILALARALGLSVVAEGVETEAQAAFLRDNGCPLQQGYLYGRPMSASAIRERVVQAARQVG